MNIFQEQKLTGDYYKDNEIIKKKMQRKELIMYWASKDVYAWLDVNQPKHDLIYAIIHHYDGISSKNIAFNYNKYIEDNQFITPEVIEHMIGIYNQYKCTFYNLGHIKKENELWYYNLSPESEISFLRMNKIKLGEKQENTNEYILELENRIKVLEKELLEKKGIS